MKSQGWERNLEEEKVIYPLWFRYLLHNATTGWSYKLGSNSLRDGSPDPSLQAEIPWGKHRLNSRWDSLTGFSVSLFNWLSSQSPPIVLLHHFLPSCMKINATNSKNRLAPQVCISDEKLEFGTLVLYFLALPASTMELYSKKSCARCRSFDLDLTNP